MKALPVILSLCLAGLVRAADPEPSDFREFTDKRGQQIEARVLSLSEDRQTLAMERRDGKTFELTVTLLSLDDQQFLRQWLGPGAPVLPGEFRIFGVLPGGEPIDIDALGAVDDPVSIHAMKPGWFVLRKNGDVMTFGDRFPGLTGIARLSVNTVWVALTKRDGGVLGAKGGPQFPEEITDAVECVAGSGHYAVLLGDGSVKVWGRGYGAEGPLDPPAPLTEVVSLASSQGQVAALHADGAISSWAPGKPDHYRETPGDGAVAIAGSIFHFIALTRSGEVHEWTGADPGKARIPPALKDEEGPFLKIRCNGATRAAQREDGTWIAWGMNGAGIVDHINSLGPVTDLAFFSEPGRTKHGYVIWLEP